MTWKPHATVAAIIEHQGHFLMVEERSRGQVVFNQPAGHIEENESILGALRRETIEETGWEITPSHFLGLYTYKAPANSVTYYRFCFIAEPVVRRTEQLDDDIIAAHWLSHEALSNGSMPLRSPLVLRCVEDYRSGKRYPLDLIVEPGY